MPRKLVMAAWDEMFPDRKPRCSKPADADSDPFVEFDRGTIGIDDPSRRRRSTIRCTRSGNFAAPFAEQFLVSPIAMRIRLEKLGLLLREVPHQRIFAGWRVDPFF